MRTWTVYVLYPVYIRRKAPVDERQHSHQLGTRHLSTPRSRQSISGTRHGIVRHIPVDVAAPVASYMHSKTRSVGRQAGRWDDS